MLISEILALNRLFELLGPLCQWCENNTWVKAMANRQVSDKYHNGCQGGHARRHGEVRTADEHQRASVSNVRDAVNSKTEGEKKDKKRTPFPSSL